MADFHHNPFAKIEKKWQTYWEKERIFEATERSKKPSYYVLSMFPYPSGAGLHVGHPLGYVAADIIARYKRSIGYNVLHPMGFDAFGLPAEQYAIQTGQHPAITTEHNIKRYKKQLKRLGLSLDWSREVITADPNYYQWTQWIFLQIFHSWYDRKKEKARPITDLKAILKKSGSKAFDAACDKNTPSITANEWNAFSKSEQQNYLNHYRLAFQSYSEVNWCPELGTVLANEEVKEGLSERGGYPVVRKKMKQWSLRITAYAERLLKGLEKLNWSEAIKQIQRNWIGRSEGTTILFPLHQPPTKVTQLSLFTTRADTIFGVTFLVVAPEHPWLKELIQGGKVTSQVVDYVSKSKSRSEKERIIAAEEITGIATGYEAIHPFTHKRLPIWVADYVLGHYGEGAIMAVPACDERDHRFAKHFGLPIKAIIANASLDAPYTSQDGILINSNFLNGLCGPTAIKTSIEQIMQNKIGERKILYKLREAIFSRQRYWGEPFPIYYKEGNAYPLSESSLPLKLPNIVDYTPTATGAPPLARSSSWKTTKGELLEENTMPAWAGSSWYFLRYMDPNNSTIFAAKDIITYWGAVDYYIGGSEHATGHLLYARFWTKFLYDLGHLPFEEPFKKMVNQGMIQGTSYFVYRIKGSNQFVSHGLRNKYDTTAIHVDIRLIQKGILDRESFKKWRPEFEKATFRLEEGKYICGSEVEKMSKSKHNVINPDQIIDQYGSDTLRLYLMFIGPFEQSQPWDSQNIEGVFRFLKKIKRWLLDNKQFSTTTMSNTTSAKQILAILQHHIEQQLDQCHFNTCISQLMIAFQKLQQLPTLSIESVQHYAKLLAPFAPHLAEEIWSAWGGKNSIALERWPNLMIQYLQKEESHYVIAINGKKRATLRVPTNRSQQIIEKEAKKLPSIQKWLQGKQIQRIVFVQNRMINLVVK